MCVTTVGAGGLQADIYCRLGGFDEKTSTKEHREELR